MTAALMPEGLFPAQQARIEAMQGLGEGLSKGVDSAMLNKALREMKDIGEGDDPHDKYIRTMAKWGPMLGENAKYLEAYDPMKRMERQEAVRGVKSGREDAIRGKIEEDIVDKLPWVRDMPEPKQKDFINSLSSNAAIKNLPKNIQRGSPEEIAEYLRGTPEYEKKLNLMEDLHDLQERRGTFSKMFDKIPFVKDAVKQDFERIIESGKEAFKGDETSFNRFVESLLGASTRLGDLFLVEQVYGKVDQAGLPRIFTSKGAEEWMRKNKGKYNEIQMKAAIFNKYRGKPYIGMNTKINKAMNSVFPKRTFEKRLSTKITN